MTTIHTRQLDKRIEVEVLSRRPGGAPAQFEAVAELVATRGKA